MKFLVIGSGQMGYGVVFDLVRSPRVEKVILTDANQEHLSAAVNRLADNRIVPCQLDITNIEEVVRLMAECNVAISCVPYLHNYELSKCALAAGTHFVDLGGNEEIVSKQFMLDELAREHNVTIVPDTGLAPGLVSILATAAADAMEEIYEIRLRVGGLPVNPEGPLKYSLCFSVNGLVNEYIEDVTVIRDGIAVKIPSLTELEPIHFPHPFHMMEAFSTSGGISTLPKTFAGRVQYLDYKTIRYQGHCEQVRLLRDLGLFDSSPLQINATEIKPRELMQELLQHKLPAYEPDVVLLRVTVSGVKNDTPTEIIWDCIDYGDAASGLSAMARMTAFPASIIAQLIARGDITQTGVLTQETSVPAPLFLAEMSSRGIDLVMSEKVPERHH